MKTGTTIAAFTLAVLMAPTAFAQQHAHQPEGDRFERMEQMMDQARRAETPEERRELMREHMEMMQKQMQKMHAMMGGDADRESKSMAGMMDHGEMGEDMQAHMKTMAERMDMMQKMLEQMLARQRMMMDPSGEDDGR